MKKNKSIEAHKDKIDALFKKVKDINDIKMQSDWAKYLCVLVSGFLEKSISLIYNDYAKKRTGTNIQNFVHSYLKGFQNPRMDKIIDLTRRFNPKWSEKLEKETDGIIKASVNSIVTNRCKIAHGESVDLTYKAVNDYYKEVLKVVRLIKNQCK